MFISHLKKRKFLDFTSPKRCHPHFSVHLKSYLTRDLASSLPTCQSAPPVCSCPHPLTTPGCSWQGPWGLQVAMANSHFSIRSLLMLSAAVDRGDCSLSSSERSLVLLFVTPPSPGLPPPSVHFLHLPSCHPPKVLCLRPSSLPPMHFYPL